MIIDAHTHAFPPRVIAARAEIAPDEPAFAEIYGSGDAAMATADDVLASMDAAGIERSVVCNFAWRSEALVEETNAYLLEAASKSAGRLIPFVSVHGGGRRAARRAATRRRRPRREAMTRARRSGRSRRRARAASGSYGRSRAATTWRTATRRICWRGHRRRTTCRCWCTRASRWVTRTRARQAGRSRRIEAFARAASGVTVIAAHWGGGLPFFALMPEVREALENVYFDTAASHLLYDAKVYRTVIDLVGADKVLFGSDFPLTSQAKALERTRAAELSATELDAVCGGNAARVLGL